MDAGLHTVPSPAPVPRAEHAYAALKQRLLEGDFPLNQRLAESTLAAELGVSRTPVRDALSRLHAERLVERASTGGYVPALPDLHEAKHLYEVRFALELTALSRPARAGERHDEVALTALRDDWRNLDEVLPSGADPEFVLVDEDFHVRLATAAGNEPLVGLLVTVNERIRLLRTHDFLTPERIARTIEQHLGIVDALLAGDAALARCRLLRHLTESMDVVEQRAAMAALRMISTARSAR